MVGEVQVPGTPAQDLIRHTSASGSLTQAVRA